MRTSQKPDATRKRGNASVSGRRALFTRRAGSLTAAVAAVVFAFAGHWLWRTLASAPPVPETCLQVDGRRPVGNAGMVWIAGGTFDMGSDAFRPEEAPARRVTVGGFWIDIHDVTNAQFARFADATGYLTLAERGGSAEPPASLVFVAPREIRDLQDPSQWWRLVRGANWRHPEGPASDIARRENHPVVHVAYEDALAYARWAGRALPSEAQWEFAARGGRAGAAFSWGDQPDTDDAPLANRWRGVFPLFNLGSQGHKGTSPVGCFPPNGYGLYDMAGNVWQWTRDGWSEGAASDAAPPVPPAARTDFRVIKGGSFLCATNFCLRYRPAARQPGEASGGAAHIGFRTVLEMEPAPARGDDRGNPGGHRNHACDGCKEGQ